MPIYSEVTPKQKTAARGCRGPGAFGVSLCCTPCHGRAGVEAVWPQPRHSGPGKPTYGPLRPQGQLLIKTRRGLCKTPQATPTASPRVHTHAGTHTHTYTLSWGPVITGPGFPGEGKEDPGPQGWGVVIRGPSEGAHWDTARLSQPGPQTSTQRKSQLCGPRLLPGAGRRQGTAGCRGLGPTGGGREKLET